MAARNKNMDAFVLMAERLGSDGQFLLQQTDENGNTVLHTAASVACGAPVSSFLCTYPLHKPKALVGLESSHINFKH